MSDQERVAAFLKEYELSQEMHNYYGRLTWEIGSIIVGGSIAGLAIVISRKPEPRFVTPIFAFAVSMMALIFLMIIRRYRVIAEVHLARCRQIEACLGMEQHIDVQKAGCKRLTLKRQDSEEEPLEKVPSPSGWTIAKILCIAEATLGIAIAICYLIIA